MSFEAVDENNIKKFLKQEIASTLDLPYDNLDENTNFLRYGISSVQTLTILNRINKNFSVDINPFAMFEYKTIEELSAYICSCMKL